MSTRISSIRTVAPWLTVLLGVSTALALGAAPAHASVSFLDQFRVVTTFALVNFYEGEDPFSHDRITSVENGAFEELAECHAGVPGNQSSSHGHQLSYILPELLLAEGSIQAQAEIGEEASFAEALGESRFTSTFAVDEPTTARLSATLHAGGNGRANLVFRVAGGELFVYRSLMSGDESLEEEFVLSPGVAYELTGHTSGYGQAFEGGGNPAFGSFSLSMVFTVSSDVTPGTPALVSRATPSVSPNPIRGEARILPSNPSGRGDVAHSAVVVLDLSGRQVRRFDAVGPNGIVWDTRDDAGRPVAAGIYLIRGASGGSTRAVVLR